MLFGADEGADPETGGARAADDTPDEPTRKVIVRPDRIGRRSVRELEVRLSWGDYVTIPPLLEEVFLDETQQFDPACRENGNACPALRRSSRHPANGRADGIPVPGSAGRQRPSPGLTLEAHARPYKIAEPDEATTRRHDRGGQSAQGNDSLLRRRHLHVSGSP